MRGGQASAAGYQPAKARDQEPGRPRDRTGDCGAWRASSLAGTGAGIDVLARRVCAVFGCVMI